MTRESRREATPAEPGPAIDQAVAWLMRLDEAPGDPAVRAGLEQWIAAHPDHARAWDRANRAFHAVPGARAAPRADSRPAPHSLARRRVVRGLAGAALAASLALAFGPGLLLRLQADHVTAVGEDRIVTLADGSRVHLAPDSAIAVAISGEGRAVTLLAGEALFEVVPDAGRPFEVRSGEVRARVVGTAFDVALGEDVVEVAVQSGIVEVSPSEASGHAPVLLGPGDAARVDRRTAALALAAVRPEAIASWRSGLLYVEGATVAHVAAVLERYRHGWIVLADDDLAARRVTGLFDLREPNRALQALAHAAGGRVRGIAFGSAILTASPQPPTAP